ncbi:MAG: hypothetical protein ACE5K0_01405 [Candidatus Methanofastidiosia archaeon]
MISNEKEKWLKMFVIEKDRVEEYLELYESLGFEVRVEDASPEECEACFGKMGEYKTIYTRTKKDSKRL